jgi:S1/P1 Nuclease
MRTIKGGFAMKLIATGTLALALATSIAQPRFALAWGDDGHKVVALVAQSFLDTDVRKRVNALLAADTDSLTAHDIASAATWADKFRDANTGAPDKKRVSGISSISRLPLPISIRPASIIHEFRLAP